MPPASLPAANVDTSAASTATHAVTAAVTGASRAAVDEDRFALDPPALANLRRRLRAPPEASLRIAFYITGHGFGHATRAYVTIAALAARGHSITVVTAAPATLYADLLARHPRLLRLRPAAAAAAVIDPGVVQSDAVSIDSARSLRALQTYLLGWEDAVAAEERWLREERVQIVLLDAPFVPQLAAKRAGLPTVLVSNFSFDAIYDAIPGFDTAPSKQLVFSLYRDNLDFLLRLPGSIVIPAFDSPPQAEKSRILNLPLVVRSARTPRNQVRAALGIPADALVVLITFGGFSATPSSSASLLAGTAAEPSATAASGTSSSAVNIVNGHHFQTAAAVNDDDDSAARWTPAQLVPDGWHSIVAVPGRKGDLLDSLILHDSTADADHDVPRARRVHVAAADAFVPDLVAAADVVAGKCGYSTCAEVVAHRVPFVYVPRPLFAEEQGLLERMMRPFGMAVEMPHSDFYNGLWSDYILAAHALAADGPRASLDCDGGDVAAVAVENIARTGRIIDA